jgi:hypothetical protein
MSGVARGEAERSVSVLLARHALVEHLD